MDALFRTALGFHEGGELQRAEHLYREVLRQDPRHATALNMLGVIGCQTGNLGAGADLIRRALALEPDNPDFNNNLGMAMLESGETQEAVPAFERAVRAKPRFAEAHFNLANALLAGGDADGAERHLRRALRARPDYADALNNLGNLLRQRGRAAEAVKVLGKAVRRAPDFAPGHYNHALALQANREFAAAVQAYRRALELDADNARVWEALGHCCRQHGALEDAAAAYARALDLEPDSPALLNALGIVRFAQTRVADARECFERAVAAAPEDAVALTHLGMAHAAAGDRSAAEALFERAIAAQPAYGDPYRHLAELELPAERRRELVAQIEALLEREPPGGDPEPRTDLRFALGKLRDDLGDYPAAFEAFAAANAEKHARVRFDADAQERFVDRLVGVFDEAFFAAHAGLGDDSELPVLIVGLPRSGTTLVEQILAAHPAAHGAGELTFFPEHVPALAATLGARRPFPDCVQGRMDEVAALAPRYLALLRERGGEAARVADKMPYNFLYLGVIATLFPRARIVHCRRDAMATCFSIFTRNLAGSHPYAYALEDLAAAYAGYRRLMAHWRGVLGAQLLDFDYEALLDDQAGQTRRLLAFVGLDWDPRCLDFHRAARTVTTASQWQVRRPLDARGRSHWQHYAGALEPLRAALAARGCLNGGDGIAP